MNSPVRNAAGILLAAGTSSRMGTPKQLLAAHGQSLLAQIIHEAVNSDLGSVVLVLGYRAEEIRDAIGNVLRHPKLKLIENRFYKQGISTSIIAGLKEAEKESDHVMILLADMPHIKTNLINLLLHQYLDSNLPLGAIEIEGKRSHPVVFNRTLYHRLYRLKGDVGARELFREHGHRVCLVEPLDFVDDRDIDTREDYVRYIRSKEEYV
jgi:molybdenum cofactor cytidylyltransferase